MKKRTFWIIIGGLVGSNVLTVLLAAYAVGRANAAHYHAEAAKLDFVLLGSHVNQISEGVRHLMEIQLRR